MSRPHATIEKHHSTFTTLLLALCVAACAKPSVTGKSARTTQPMASSMPASEATKSTGTPTSFPEPEHASPAAKDFADQDVAATLRTLFDRMYAIGETDGDLLRWDAAVAGAAVHIAERMRDQSKQLELTQPVNDEDTALVFASMNGYPQVVDELLRYDSVRRTLEQRGPYQMTPWQLANLAPRLTLLSINPTIRTNDWKLIPYMVETPYYTHKAYAPYQRVRASLAAAGAKQDTKELREFLESSSVCPVDVKERVRKADDVLLTLLDVVLNDKRYGLPSVLPSSEPRP